MGTTTTTELQGALPAELAARVQLALADGVPANTRKAYRSAWARFERWAAAHGLPALPAPAGSLAAYLEAIVSGGGTLATARLHRAAVNKAHDLAGHARPDTHEVAPLLKALTRSHGAAQRQAAPLTAEALAAIRATAHRPRKARAGALETAGAAAARGDLDIAIASVMRDGLLRVSEAAALTWGDIEPAPDGAGRAMVYRLKTLDRQWAYFGAPTMAALHRIQPAEVDGGAPVFGLRPDALAARLKAMARAAGLGDGFSGHSARVGRVSRPARRVSHALYRV